MLAAAGRNHHQPAESWVALAARLPNGGRRFATRHVASPGEPDVATQGSFARGRYLGAPRGGAAPDWLRWPEADRSRAPGRFEAANGQALQFTGQHAGGPAALCFRPEHAALSQAGTTGNNIAVTVNAVTYLGPVTEYELVSEAGDRLLVSASSSGDAGEPREGDKLALAWAEEDAFVVD